MAGFFAVDSILDPDHGQSQVSLDIVKQKPLTGDIDKRIIRKEFLNICNVISKELNKPADITFVDR